MGQVTLSLPSDGTTIDASDVNTPFNTLVNEFNGNIDDNNVKTGANISGAKLNDASIPGKKFDSTTYGGWIAGVLPSVSSVTANGNRSYDVVFASTVASYLTPGMRLRTTRTVAAPTGAISLNGTSQYLSKSSPTGMAQTDSITVVQWVKPTGYQLGYLQSKTTTPGTDGWRFYLDANGAVNANGNGRYSTSYQSLPLNKWTHVAVTLSMSTSTVNMYFDGVLVPSSALSGAGATFTSSGNYRIGASPTPTEYFKGSLAQVGYFNAILSASTIRSYISQTLSGSETNCVSAFKLDQASGLNDLNANANNLTASGSPTYSTDSPFSVDANGTPGGSYDYAIVTKVATTTATVQVPEANTIPTTGGVSAVDLSTQKAPYGMPVQRGKWNVENLYLASETVTFGGLNQWTTSNQRLTVPIGEWTLSYQGTYRAASTVAGNRSIVFILDNSPTNAVYNQYMTTRIFVQGQSTYDSTMTKSTNITLAAATNYSIYGQIDSSTGTETFLINGAQGASVIRAECAYL